MPVCVRKPQIPSAGHVRFGFSFGLFGPATKQAKNQQAAWEEAEHAWPKGPLAPKFGSSYARKGPGGVASALGVRNRRPALIGVRSNGSALSAFGFPGDVAWWACAHHVFGRLVY